MVQSIATEGHEGSKRADEAGGSQMKRTVQPRPPRALDTARVGLMPARRVAPMLRAAALLATAVLLAASCAPGEGDGGDSEGGGEGPIRIGASLPLTGEFSQPGTAAQQGYEVWQAMVNEDGGLLGREVRLEILDDASDQNTVVADYNRLITRENVDLLLGTFSSLLNLPASAVAERNRMVYVEPAGGAPEIFQRGFEYLFFAQPATAPHQADIFVEYLEGLPENERPKTAAYPTQDDPFTKPVIDTIRSELESLGVETVYSTVYPPDTTNFDSIANSITSETPDLVAQGAVFEDGIGLIRSMRKSGFNPKILFQTSAPSNGSQYAEAIGEQNTEGVFYSVSWSDEADYPLNDEFVNAYQEEFGGIPPEDAADAFAAAQVLQAAVEAVGEIDQDKIKDWLHENSVETILGELSWNERGEPEQEFLLAQWQSGEPDIVLPEEVATTDQIVYPKPGWK
jgi:branched-chain amino acid transport system substrate-binding protein